MIENGQKWEITTRSWGRGAIVVAVAYLLFLVSELILVVITAVVVASAIEPAVGWAKKRNIPRLPIVFLGYLASAFMLAGLFYFLLLPLVGEISSFIKTLTIYSNSVTSGGD